MERAALPVQLEQRETSGQGGSQTATVAESNLPGGIIGHYPGSRPAIGRVFQGGTASTQEAARQLDEYFKGERQAFDLPLVMAGSDFQQRVWQELLKIPYGGTISYGELAKRIGQAQAVRAVANANGANALSIFIPCHRVIGSNRSLTGYAGGLAAKQYLLAWEQAKSYKITSE